MDDRVLSVNGQGQEMLEKALELALLQSGSSGFKAWCQDPSKGLVLHWAAGDGNFPFLSGSRPVNQIAEEILDWLKGDFAKSILEQDELHNDPNVDIEAAWHLYCEEWGHVGEHTYAVCAIRPVYVAVGQ